jgi:hypothetical protein
MKLLRKYILESLHTMSAVAVHNFTFKSRTVTRISKVKIYKTTLQSFAMHGCEMRSMTEKDKVILNTWERNILKKVYGAVN